MIFSRIRPGTLAAFGKASGPVFTFRTVCPPEIKMLPQQPKVNGLVDTDEIDPLFAGHDFLSAK
jgi:hypothetical protein